MRISVYHHHTLFPSSISACEMTHYLNRLGHSIGFDRVAVLIKEFLLLTKWQVWSGNMPRYFDELHSLRPTPSWIICEASRSHAKSEWRKWYQIYEMVIAPAIVSRRRLMSSGSQHIAITDDAVSTPPYRFKMVWRRSCGRTSKWIGLGQGASSTPDWGIEDARQYNRLRRERKWWAAATAGRDSRKQISWLIFGIA